MMGGDDLAEIYKMLETTGTSVKQHSKAYNNLKLQVDSLNKNATEALGQFASSSDDI